MWVYSYRLVVVDSQRTQAPSRGFLNYSWPIPRYRPEQKMHNLAYKPGDTMSSDYHEFYHLRWLDQTVYAHAMIILNPVTSIYPPLKTSISGMTRFGLKLENQRECYDQIRQGKKWWHVQKQILHRCFTINWSEWRGEITTHRLRVKWTRTTCCINSVVLWAARDSIVRAYAKPLRYEECQSVVD